MDQQQTPERARRARDAGLARLRRLTGTTVGVALALAAAFAGVAASSTHGHKALRASRRPLRPPVPRNGPEPKLPAARAPVVAAPPPAPPPMPPLSSPGTSPPVAVSGGS